jgi:error-prone DNA polymerase
LASGLPRQFVDNVFEQIKGFAHYGFPESHAASFALLAYASSYLKCHHPAEFACALINSQPMGFYSVHSLVDDAKRHGVEVLPVHLNFSDWDCVITREGALQLGWRVVKGMAERDARAIVEARGERPFTAITDFCSRVRLGPNLMHRLALGDAFRALANSSAGATRDGNDQRDALWEILACQLMLEPDPDTGQMNLFSGAALIDNARGLFRSLDELESIKADYGAFGLSVRGHPMQALRAKMRRLPSSTTAHGRAAAHGMALTIAGLVIVRQRPPTAKGTAFATLEDEHGFLDLTLRREIVERYEDVFGAHAFLIAEGTIQRDRNSMSLLVRRLRPLWPDSVAPHTVSIAPMGTPPAQKSAEATKELSAAQHYESQTGVYTIG